MPRSSPARRVVAPSPRRALTSWSRASYLKLAAFSVPSSSPPPPPPLLLLLLLLFSSSSSSSSSPPPPLLLLLLLLLLFFFFFVYVLSYGPHSPSLSSSPQHVKIEAGLLIPAAISTRIRAPPKMRNSTAALALLLPTAFRLPQPQLIHDKVEKRRRGIGRRRPVNLLVPGRFAAGWKMGGIAS